MPDLSVQQLRALFDSLGIQYEYLTDNESKLKADCAKLREYIETEVQQIQSLNNDFEKLRQDFVQRRGAGCPSGNRSSSASPNLPLKRQAIKAGHRAFPIRRKP
jgi:hypothetical protein